MKRAFSFLGSSEKQIFPFFHGVPVAPLKVIGPRGDFHLFEGALVDTGAALTSVPISVCRQLNLPYVFTRRIYTFSGWVNVRIHSFRLVRIEESVAHVREGTLLSGFV
ncbi:MAG: hypothetical protein ACE5OW_08445 [Candidatus Bathyarchaeia archaeon]